MYRTGTIKSKLDTNSQKKLGKERENRKRKKKKDEISIPPFHVNDDINSFFPSVSPALTNPSLSLSYGTHTLRQAQHSFLLKATLGKKASSTLVLDCDAAYAVYV